MKKAARYLLPRADFRKGAVAFGIEINLERFLIRPHIHLGFHNFQDVGIYGLLNRRYRKSPSLRAGLALAAAGLDDTRYLNYGGASSASPRSLRGVAELRPPLLAPIRKTNYYSRTFSTALAAIHPR